MRTTTATADALTELERRFARVDDGARCALAGQQRAAVASLVQLGRESVEQHVDRSVPGAGRFLIAPIVDLVHGRAVIDAAHVDKLPDWSDGGHDSGTVPAERYGNASVAVRVRSTRTHGADAGIEVSTVDTDEDGGPSAAARRFAAPIIASHERLLSGLRSLGNASDEDLGAAAESLGHELGRYINLVGTVVYPELDRLTHGTAADPTWVAERNAESASAILKQLRSSHALDSDAVRALTDDLVALIDSDDTIALPLLCRRLDDHDLDRLADAAHEVVANAVESTASSSFGSAPN